LQTKEINLQRAGKRIPKFVLNRLLPISSTGSFAVEKRIVQAIKNTFLVISGAAGKKLKKELIEEQEIILNLSDILSEAYITESLLLRIQKLATRSDLNPEKYDAKVKMLHLYLYEALDITQKAAKDAVASFATGMQKKQLNYIVGKMLDAPDWNPKKLRRGIARYVLEQEEYCF